MRQSKISFLLSKDEMKTLESILYLEPCLVDGIETAKAENGKYRVEFFTDDLVAFLEALLFSANYIHSCSEREELHNLCNKVRNYLVLSQGLSQYRL